MPALAACEPWAFTQQPPMTTRDFSKAAARRGLFVDDPLLRELWRVGALAPIVEVRRRRSGPPCPSRIPEPYVSGTWAREVRLARDRGRLIDPEDLGFRPQVRFKPPPGGSHSWWNGLIYTRWQLLALERFSRLVHRMAPGRGIPVRRDDNRRVPRPRPLTDQAREEAGRLRRLAQLLVALEARYFPEIKKPWVHLSNATFEEWHTYRGHFDPSTVITRFGWTPEELARTADELLFRAGSSDPLKGEWSELVQRASSRSWDKLEGHIVVALDARIAAEILLLCYEDLAQRSQAPTLSDHPEWCGSQERRLSRSATSLDGALSALGLSPHPGVVLVVEGETEEFLFPLVRDRLRFTDADGIVRSVVMRGTKADLTKLVALAAGPLIDRPHGKDWLLMKPPTRVLVAVDPDDPFDTDKKIEKVRANMIDEIVAVIRAQGIEPDRHELDSLIRIETWSQSRFEFAHFDDEELASAIEIVHPDCNGLTHERLVAALGEHRKHGQDIKKAWARWRKPPSKRALAKVLWPRLEAKIAATEAGQVAAVPEVVLRLQLAYQDAADRPAGRWVLRGHSGSAYDADLVASRGTE